jgi:hypothetical protein
MTVPRTYRVADVASLSGVSIRALHHYDAIGLLIPTGRTEAGYRLYTDADLLRLQQILIERELGFRSRRSSGRWTTLASITARRSSASGDAWKRRRGRSARCCARWTPRWPS